MRNLRRSISEQKRGRGSSFLGNCDVSREQERASLTMYQKSISVCLCAVVPLALSVSTAWATAPLARPMPWLNGVTTESVYVCAESTNITDLTVPIRPNDGLRQLCYHQLHPDHRGCWRRPLKLCPQHQAHRPTAKHQVPLQGIPRLDGVDQRL